MKNVTVNLPRSSNSTVYPLYTILVGEKYKIEKGILLSSRKTKRGGAIIVGKEEMNAPYLVVRRGTPNTRVFYCSLIGEDEGNIEFLSVANPRELANGIVAFISPDTLYPKSYEVKGIETICKCEVCQFKKKYVLPEEGTSFCKNCGAKEITYQPLLGSRPPGEIVKNRVKKQDKIYDYSVVKMIEGDAIRIGKDVLRYEEGRLSLINIA